MRYDVGRGGQRLQVVDGEVGHPDRAGSAGGVELLEHLPDLDVAGAVVRADRVPRPRGVDQVQVDDTEVEPLFRSLERAPGTGRVLDLRRQLRGDEDLGAVDAAVADRPTDAGLVAVGEGGVDVPVAGVEGAPDGVVRLRPVGDLPRAEPDLRDGDVAGDGERVGECRHEAGRYDAVRYPTWALTRRRRGRRRPRPRGGRGRPRGSARGRSASTAAGCRRRTSGSRAGSR